MKLSNLEEIYLSDGYLIVGIDEVGRGCLAGPVYVCGYLKNSIHNVIDQVNDSKSISENKREKVFEIISNDLYHIAIRTNIEIDEMGIARCIEDSIAEICDYFRERYSEKIIFLIDGYFKNLPIVENSEIFLIEKGDTIHYTIAAASILAKVSRDKFMKELGLKYDSLYKFERNVGYGTKDHMYAIMKLGLTDIHRKSFCGNFI